MVSLTSPTVTVNSDASTPERALSSFGVSPGQPWRALRDALELGARRVQNEFIAPFTFPLSEGRDDAIVVRPRVRLRASPRPNARVLVLLSRWEHVTLDRSHRYDVGLFERSDRPTGPAAWARVTTSRSTVGYVYGKLLDTSDAPSFVFGRVDGQWKLRAITVGE